MPHPWQTRLSVPLLQLLARGGRPVGEAKCPLSTPILSLHRGGERPESRHCKPRQEAQTLLTFGVIFERHDSCLPFILGRATSIDIHTGGLEMDMRD